MVFHRRGRYPARLWRLVRLAWGDLVAGGVIFTAGLSGWVQATQQDDIHRAIMEQSERDKARDKPQE